MSTQVLGVVKPITPEVKATTAGQPEFADLTSVVRGFNFLTNRVANTLFFNRQLDVLPLWQTHVYYCMDEGCQNQSDKPFQATPLETFFRGEKELPKMWVSEEGIILCQMHSHQYWQKYGYILAPLGMVLERLEEIKEDPVIKVVMKKMSQATKCAWCGATFISFCETYVPNNKVFDQLYEQMEEQQESNNWSVDFNDLVERMVEILNLGRDNDDHPRVICESCKNKGERITFQALKTDRVVITNTFGKIRKVKMFITAGLVFSLIERRRQKFV